MRLIDADELLESSFLTYSYISNDIRTGIGVAKYLIRMAETVEGKTGVWEDNIEYVSGNPWINSDTIGCSNCKTSFSKISNCTETFKYCPNCGAKMVAEK